MDNESKGKLIALEAFITEILLTMDSAQANRVLSAAQAACQRESQDLVPHSSGVWNRIRRRVPAA